MPLVFGRSPEEHQGTPGSAFRVDGAQGGYWFVSRISIVRENVLRTNSDGALAGPASDFSVTSASGDLVPRAVREGLLRLERAHEDEAHEADQEQVLLGPGERADQPRQHRAAELGSRARHRCTGRDP